MSLIFKKLSKLDQLLSLILILILALSAQSLSSLTTNANSSYHKTNGQFVWYSAPINDSKSELFTSDEDGTNVREVTSDNVQNGNPQWYPDGTRIVFDRPGPGKAANSVDHSIYIIDRDGQNQKLLLDYLSIPSPLCLDGSCQIYDASFNPAGTKVAFHMLRSGYGVKIMIADYDYASNSLSNLTYMGNSSYLSNSDSDREPIWSSDGSKIVVAHAITSNTRTIRVYNVSDGSVYYESAADVWNESPQFGPHAGDNLTVASKPATGEIFVIDADNGQGASAPFYTNASIATGASPTWSPNGRKIAWGGTQGKIHILDYESKNLTDFAVSTTGDIKELDWTFSKVVNDQTGLPDVYVECTTEIGKSCTVSIPEFCKNDIITQPARGTSQVTGGKVTYTPAISSLDEENYVHLREDSLGNSAKCFVKIKFTEPTGNPLNPLSPNSPLNPLVPKTGLVSGIMIIILTSALAIGIVYLSNRIERQKKKQESEK